MTKISYSFEDRGIDRQNQFGNVLSKTFRMIYDTPIKAEKLVGDEENIPPPYTIGGRHK